MNKQNHSLILDEQLHARLGDLAHKAGHTIEEHAMDVLRSYADDQERLTAEYEEDDQRWQNFVSTGKAVSVDQIKTKLKQFASEPAKQD